MASNSPSERSTGSFAGAVAGAPAAPPAIEARMADYYVQRASYYERVYHKPERQVDLRAMERWLAPQFAGRRVLEVACGTGWWTPHGAAQAAHWLATDLNPETMAVARSKALPRHADGSPRVSFREVDAYTWAGLPARDCGGANEVDAPPFGGAFAGCWWSHVPLQRLPAWLDSLHAHLAPGARVVMLDNSFVQTSSTPISHSDALGNTFQTRTLDDGSTHEVLKNFPTPAQAFAVLGPRARQPQWIAWEHYWALQYTLA